MFADIGGLVGLIIFAVIAIISALIKKKQEEPFELPPELKPRGDQPKPPRRSWEEELRRVLEPSPVPPPIVQHVPAPPLPAHLPPPPRRPDVEHGWDEGRIEVTLPTPHPNITPTFHPPRGLVESEERYAGAASLQERVSLHMADVTRHRVGTTLVQRTAASMEATDAAKIIRTRRGVRTAIIASIILGPPRGLEG